MRRVKTWPLGMAIIAATMLFACTGAEQYEYRSNNEVPEGPGIFSGEDGSFEVFRKEYE